MTLTTQSESPPSPYGFARPVGLLEEVVGAWHGLGVWGCCWGVPICGHRTVNPQRTGHAVRGDGRSYARPRCCAGHIRGHIVVINRGSRAERR